jgi:hypothetical protein
MQPRSRQQGSAKASIATCVCERECLLASSQAESAATPRLSPGRPRERGGSDAALDDASLALLASLREARRMLTCCLLLWTSKASSQLRRRGCTQAGAAEQPPGSGSGLARAAPLLPRRGHNIREETPVLCLVWG